MQFIEPRTEISWLLQFWTKSFQLSRKGISNIISFMILANLDHKRNLWETGSQWWALTGHVGVGPSTVIAPTDLSWKHWLTSRASSSHQGHSYFSFSSTAHLHHCNWKFRQWSRVQRILAHSSLTLPLPISHSSFLPDSLPWFSPAQNSMQNQ